MVEVRIGIEVVAHFMTANWRRLRSDIVAATALSSDSILIVRRRHRLLFFPHFPVKIFYAFPLRVNLGKENWGAANCQLTNHLERPLRVKMKTRSIFSGGGG